jgi:hypothetical protein
LSFVNVPPTFESFSNWYFKTIVTFSPHDWNDKIRFDQHVWINLLWSFVAFCLSLWMCAHFIGTGCDHPHHIYKRYQGEMNHLFFLLVHIHPYMWGDDNWCVIYWNFQLLNNEIQNSHLGLSHIVFATCFIFMSWYICHIYICCTYKLYFGCAYATNCLICFNFIQVTYIFHWIILLVFN